jgi:hypothetical protein
VSIFLDKRQFGRKRRRRKNDMKLDVRKVMCYSDDRRHNKLIIIIIIINKILMFNFIVYCYDLEVSL